MAQLVRFTAAEIIARYNKGERSFSRVNLRGADFSRADLRGASFRSARLSEANFQGALLTHVQFKEADLSGSSFVASLVNASDLIGADFVGANMQHMDLTGAHLNRANCSGADLRHAFINNAVVDDVTFTEAKLDEVMLASAHFTNVDLSPFCDAKNIRHESPSSIDSLAVIRSYRHPKLKQFMVDCGVPELFATYMIDCAASIGDPLLKKLMQSTFISYGAPDEQFARKLYESLKSHNVVAFFFPETARVGERIDDEVYRRIQENDRILLICSRNSLTRTGVLNEIQETLDREAREGGATYLLPITIDDYVFEEWRDSNPGLAERVTRRIIADFRNTRTKVNFEKALSRVIDALKLRKPDEK